jgi:AraC-like DNA-binding protein
MTAVANTSGGGESGRRTGSHGWSDEVVKYLRSRGLAANRGGEELLLSLLATAPDPLGRVTVSRLAGMLHLSRRTLGRRCVLAGLPCPQQVLCLSRVLRTISKINETGWLIERAARATGWPDPFCFSNACQRLTGMRPSEMRGLHPTLIAEAWLQRQLVLGHVFLTEPDPPPCPACGRPVGFGGSRPYGRAPTR